MARKKQQQQRNDKSKPKPWCWYCDREFEEEKVLVQHQRMKHFQCNICHRKLNSASGLVIHMAQVHRQVMEKVPNAIDGHDTPELEIFGSDGVPREDLQRHLDKLPPVPYTRSRLIIGDSSILPILAAQKVSVAAQLAESKNMTVQGVLLPSQSQSSYQNVMKPMVASSNTVATAAPVTVSSVHNGQSSFSPSLSCSNSNNNAIPPNFYNPYGGGGYGMIMPGYGTAVGSAPGYYPYPPQMPIPIPPTFPAYPNQQYMASSAAAAYYQQQQQYAQSSPSLPPQDPPKSTSTITPTVLPTTSQLAPSTSTTIASNATTTKSQVSTADQQSV